jgi:hypothetical protein
MNTLAPMRRFAALTTALVLGLACALILASCGGGGGTLSSANATELNQLLDQIEQRAQAGDCAGAGSLAQQVAQSVDKRTDIDAKLRSALVDGFQRVQALSSDPTTCSGTGTSVTTTEETTTQETTPTQTTETTPTETTPTQTTPTQTTTTPTTTGTGGTDGSGGIGTP